MNEEDGTGGSYQGSGNKEQERKDGSPPSPSPTPSPTLKLRRSKKATDINESYGVLKRLRRIKKGKVRSPPTPRLRRIEKKKGKIQDESVLNFEFWTLKLRRRCKIFVACRVVNCSKVP